MARSRSLAGFMLITRMFMFLLICLDNPKAAMGYDLLLWAGHFNSLSFYKTHLNYLFHGFLPEH